MDSQKGECKYVIPIRIDLRRVMGINLEWNKESAKKEKNSLLQHWGSSNKQNTYTGKLENLLVDAS